MNQAKTRENNFLQACLITPTRPETRAGLPILCAIMTRRIRWGESR